MAEWICAQTGERQWEITAIEGGVTLTSVLELGPVFPTSTPADVEKWAANEMKPILYAMREELDYWAEPE